MPKESFGRAVIYWRNNPERLTLTGVKCDNCGQANFPRKAICSNCNNKMGKLVVRQNFPQMAPVDEIGPG